MFCGFKKKLTKPNIFRYQKLRPLYHIGKKRILTPIGQVTNAKTLLYPKPNHLFYCSAKPR